MEQTNMQQPPAMRPMIPVGAILTMLTVYGNMGFEARQAVAFVSEEALHKLALDTFNDPEAPNFMFFICGIYKGKAEL